MNVATRVLDQAGSRLQPLGFHPSADGRAFQSDGVLLRPERRWCVLQMAAEPSADPLADLLGKPGLWKPCPGGRPVREFHLPLAALGPGGLDAEGTDVLRTCAEWALATARGELPAGWACPPREQVERSIPVGAQTIQAGPFVRQGELVHAADRLALRFPIVPMLPSALPESRRDWLSRLMLDALDRWRMVRVGWSGSMERRAIEAEVDLSGAPHEVLERLLPMALDALRWVVEWLIWPANFLADIRVECRLLDVFPSGPVPQKGAQP